MDPAALLCPDRLAALVLDLGLNDDGLADFPPSLRPQCGGGLRIWQYPQEFAAYLAQALERVPRSYIELGIRHGGTFVTTVECIARRGGLERALGIDIMPCPSMAEYTALNPKATFLQANTQSPEFAAVLAENGTFDLAFIDANHDEAECRKELCLLRDRCAMVAFHDIANSDFPAIGRVWREVKERGGHRCFEFVADYAEPHTPMGIGLAIRKERP